MKTLLALMALTALAGAASAEYLPQGSPAVGGARRIVLIYNGRGHRQWVADDFVPLITRVDGKGKPTSDRMFDTFLVLPLGLETGHAFCPGFGETPADRQALETYIHGTLFGGKDQLRKMDAAVASVAGRTKQPGLRMTVFLALPYPMPEQTTFGPVVRGGPSLDLSKPAHRFAAVEWYRNTATELWRKAKFKRLDLAGWYWINEGTRGGDAQLIPQEAAAVHKAGKRFLFIPYNGAPGADRWRELGFDAAIFQPNFFFNESNWPASRIDEAARFAKRNGMGLEFELDERVQKKPEYRDRYRAYLAAARRQGAQKGVIAWYMGEAALVDCAFSTDPDARAIYDVTADFIRDTTKR